MRNIVYAAGFALAAFPTSSRASSCVAPGSNAEFWPRTTVSQYQACVQREATAARADPLAAIRDRAFADRFNHGITALGMMPLEHYHLDFLTPYINRMVNDTSYTEAVRQGIQARFDHFQTAFDAASANPNFDAAQGRALLTNWGELRASFETMREETNLPAEKALLTRLIQNGDVLSDSVGLIRVAQTPGLTAAQVRQIIKEELGISNAALEARLKKYLSGIVGIGAAEGERNSPGATERDVRLIADYTALGQSLVGVAAYAGILNQRDAMTMSRTIQGVSQIATAVTMMEGMSGAALAGPYGMAIGGALTLAGAFAQQGPSESAQIMSMLRALSKQIEHLQFTVEQGFSQLGEQINQSETRIMGRLGDILANQADMQQALADFRQEVAGYRSEMLQSRYADHLARAAAFEAEIRYDDPSCLKPFGGFKQISRQACVTKYAEFLRRFETTENARLIGAADSSLSGQLGPEDRISPIVTDLNKKYPDLVPKLTPRHRPTLDLLAQRVNLLGAYNHGLRNNKDYKRLRDRIVAAQADNDRLFKMLAAAELRGHLREDYRKELQRVFALISGRRAYYLGNKSTSLADAVHLQEVTAYNTPAALHRRALEWTRSGDNRIYNYLEGDPADVAFIADEAMAATLSPHRDFANRITNYAAIALKPVPIEAGIFPDAAIGPTWVRPCNREASYPSIPLARSVMAKALNPEVAALAAAPEGTVDVCYQPNVAPHDSNIGVGNTTEGFGTIVSRMRAQGYGEDYQNCRVRVDWDDYFKRTYGSQPEYGRTDFEQCHGDHLHHQLLARTEQAHSVTLRVTMNFRGYASPLYDESVTIAYPDEALDKCFLPYDKDGHDNKFNVLMPFRQLYPSPVRQACASLEQMVARGLAELKPKVDAFLLLRTTRNEPDAPAITFREAAGAISDEVADTNLGSFVDSIMPPPAQTAELDRLAALIAAVNSLNADVLPVKDMSEAYMNSAELRSFLLNRIADRETNTLHDLDIVRSSKLVVESLL